MNEHDIFTSVLGEVFETELDGLTAEITLDREHEFSDKFDRKMRKLIKRRSRSYFSLICTAGRRAACIAVIVLLLLANPFTVNAVKQRILGFLKEDHSDHAELTVDIDDNTECMQTLETVYDISDIPEGFEIYQVSDSPAWHYVMYKKDRDYIMFSQMLVQDYHPYLDNEQSGFDELEDRGNNYLIHYVIGTDQCTFIWNDGVYAFEVTSIHGREKTLELCRSVKPRE